ncbi:MAG: benzoyl-CoA reductase, bzd-type, subunit Q [Deltaproteobacteria bacterium]|nr:benzoyl-CoA reductase, bzd-type, subunit Q [Deltaproteobacteria bacterium]
MREEQEQPFWSWPETSWGNPDAGWEDAGYVTVGIDVGSVSSQAVIMADGQVIAYGNRRTGSNSPDSAGKAMDFATEAMGGIPEDRIDYLIGTGYGRVNVPMADRTLTEIACHARGAMFMFGPEVRTVLDVGGQDIKAIQCDQRGKVTNFIMNDKCAAGTGRGMEVFSDLLGIPIQELGERSFQAGEEPRAVSNVCVVYAKSEAAGLLRSGWSTEEVLAAYCRAMAERILSLLDKIEVVPGFAVTGGLAKNRGVMDRLMPMVGLERMKTEWDPQIAGAVGAALFGHALCLKGKKRKAGRG